MSVYNPNIHHRRSIRLRGYDYAQAGLNFITICCENKICRFGKIVGAENLPLNAPPHMQLNDAGRIADECWLEIPQHFPNTILHEHIEMPNHVHGIIELLPNVGVDDGVGAENLPPLQVPFKSPSKTIGSIVRGYKIGITKWFRNNTNIEAIWQRNYYEHIIRDERSYQNISNYIVNNPLKWRNDKFYK